MSLEELFELRARRTDLRTEVMGGATTFVALSYIVFVQPAVLATTGMDAGAVLTATCLASAFATALMGLWARYPIAVAPAMGHNFYFAFVVAGPLAAGGLGYPWQVALGANCVAGIAFLVLSLVGLRERRIDAIPASLQHAIAGGIGLLLALVGFEWAGIVRAAPGTLLALGDLRRPATLVAVGGTLLVAALLARRMRGAILLGTLATGAAAVAIGIVPYGGLLAAPPEPAADARPPRSRRRLRSAPRARGLRALLPRTLRHRRDPRRRHRARWIPRERPAAAGARGHGDGRARNDRRHRARDVHGDGVRRERGGGGSRPGMRRSTRSSRLRSLPSAASCCAASSTSPSATHP